MTRAWGAFLDWLVTDGGWATVVRYAVLALLAWIVMHALRAP